MDKLIRILGIPFEGSIDLSTKVYQMLFKEDNGIAVTMNYNVYKYAVLVAYLLIMPLKYFLVGFPAIVLFIIWVVITDLALVGSKIIKIEYI